MPWPIVLAIIFALSTSFSNAGDPCRFKHPSRGVIDLTSLARTDGNAAYVYKITPTGTGYKYSYNPCRPFAEGPNCSDASACQVSMDGQVSSTLSKQESARWSVGTSRSSVPTVSYAYEDKRVVVELICSTNETNRFEIVDEPLNNTYKFRLTHKCACWNGCSEPSDPPCGPSCQIYENGTCVIKSGWCFIAQKCYMAGETSRNDSFTCLQCLPQLNQTQWSFNPQCSYLPACVNDSIRNQNTCPQNISNAFYANPEQAINEFYNYIECAQDRQACQAGFFKTEGFPRPLACCPGYFCATGQVCMIPCRPGAYCPSPLSAVDGICKTDVVCPRREPKDYEQYGCGGSTFEGYCPAGHSCPNPGTKIDCPNTTSYCPTGVVEPLSCLSSFACYNGRAHRGNLFRVIFGVMAVFLFLYIFSAIFSQWLTLKSPCFGRSTSLKPDGVSNYFRKRNPLDQSQPRFQLNIHMSQAKLRDVTRFDPLRNEGFTGCIAAGRITALMGGSGCGKSSLLDTIHGRRRLRDGTIKFAQHEPLSNALSDYIGYVPQADIMHDDLTVFETVYYSARARQLGHSHETIKQDVCFVLGRLGLSRMHNNMTKTLSGGQRKRVNVAMEIAACPKVLLLDEPTSGLDTASCDDLLDLLELIKYSQDGPVAIIMVIHQPSYELFLKIDDIFFLTPTCCLAYQGPREQALQHLKELLFQTDPGRRPSDRHNDSDTCFIMLTKAPDHVDNHNKEDRAIEQELDAYSWQKRFFLPFLYVMSRSMKQCYVRGVLAEAAYLLAYFLLGSSIGYLFQNRQQDACDILTLSTIYFLISLAFGILTCISSQRLFGVEIIDRTFERESRTYFHPFQYWLAKSLIDILRLILYPLVFLSMLYIQLVPRGPFHFYLGVMILLSFVCSGIGQLASVFFNRIEYAYLGATILALLSCLLSGFSPQKRDLGGAAGLVTFSFSRHIQHLLYSHETSFYVRGAPNGTHIWYGSIEFFRDQYSYEDSEHPYFWLIAGGIMLRLLTLIILYIKSEYRSSRRFYVANTVPLLKSLLKCEPCCKKKTSLLASIEL